MKMARCPPTPAFRGQVWGQRHHRPQQSQQSTHQQQEARTELARSPCLRCCPRLPWPKISGDAGAGGGRKGVQRAEIEKGMTSAGYWLLAFATTASADVISPPIPLGRELSVAVTAALGWHANKSPSSATLQIKPSSDNHLFWNMCCSGKWRTRDFARKSSNAMFSLFVGWAKLFPLRGHHWKEPFQTHLLLHAVFPESLRKLGAQGNLRKL